MKKLLVTIALGATIISTAAVAQERGGRGGHGGWTQQDQTRAQAQQMADGIFQRFDTNRDGTVTRQEAEAAGAQYGERAQRMIDRVFGTAQSLTLQQFEAQALARFDRDDLNHDGVVTSAERQQARSALKAERSDQTPGQ